MTDHSGAGRKWTYPTLAGGFGAVFAALAVVVATGRPALDLAAARWIADHRMPAAIPVADAFSFVGSTGCLVPIGLVLAVLVWRRDGWRPVAWLVVADVGAMLVYAAVNLAMRSPRPPMPLRVLGSLGWSFPSGHATQAVVFWPSLAIIGAPAHRWLLASAIAMAVAIGASRLYLDVHWTTDVAAGYALGLAWLFAVLALRSRRASVRAS